MTARQKHSLSNDAITVQPATTRRGLLIRSLLAGGLVGCTQRVVAAHPPDATAASSGQQLAQAGVTPPRQGTDQDPEDPPGRGTRFNDRARRAALTASDKDPTDRAGGCRGPGCNPGRGNQLTDNRDPPTPRWTGRSDRDSGDPANHGR